MMEKNKILMIGDSLIEYGNWNALFGYEIINRGIGGDTAYGVSCRIEKSLKSRPQKICLMVGANDIMAGESIKTISNQYEEILCKIRAELKGVEIIIHKVLPCNKEKFFFVFDNDQVEKLNIEIVQLGKEYDATCIDLWDILTEQGELIKKYTIDGVHLTKEAYRLWSERLRIYLD